MTKTEMADSRWLRRVGLVAFAALAGCTPDADEHTVTRALHGTDEMPAMRVFTDLPVTPPTRTNAAIAQDFLDLAFRTESGGEIAAFTRFEGPVSLRIAGEAPGTLVSDLRALLARLHDEVEIDIFLTGASEAAITVEAVPRAGIAHAAPRATCFAVPRVRDWEDFLARAGSPVVDWTTLARRDRAAIFVPMDAAPQEIRDCLHEELAQALGPPNDLWRLPDSVFNDDNAHSVLTGFDMLVLRIFHSHDLRSGMTRDEVAAALPALLARLNPAGELEGGPVAETPKHWIQAIETALATEELPAARRRAAAQAVGIARAEGWDGVRLGHALHVEAHLTAGIAPDRAQALEEEAMDIFRTRPETAPHRAQAALQLAGFALRAGDAAKVLALVDEAAPLAEAHGDALRLSQLLMFRAEALELQGRPAEAAGARLDSRAWGRYGIGSEDAILAREASIAALNPARRSIP